jgi:ATP phosphoribosyltransferase regulatory subunit
MTVADRWLLPDGVEEILPAQAQRIEHLRRNLLDLYSSWGYELVIPPLIEFSESLLIGLGSDVDLQTFKVVDQISGRTLAIRADITPQAARMDAHSLRRKGTTRLCYAGTVLHTKPSSLMASRTPIEVGAELFGDASVASDCEIILLMLETLRVAGAEQVHLDLGHVGIYRVLVRAAGMLEDEERALFKALQSKAMSEVDRLISASVREKSLADMLKHLARLNGDRSVLAKARKLLAAAPRAVMDALDCLDAVAERVSRRMPEVQLYFDLSELRGYHYHTGLVFAALVPGHGHALANGGRYDDIGKVFGRGRPATGFSADLLALSGLKADLDVRKGSIFAVESDDPQFWELVQELREQGERVICGLEAQPAPPDCDRMLMQLDGSWQVRAIS